MQTPIENPLGIDGIEYIEFATTQPQALGNVLQMMGFAPVARHRSREVVRYTQGDMNIIVNASLGPVGAALGATAGATAGLGEPHTPRLAAVAFRVRDAAFAHKQCIDLGAWDMPTRASAMELNIPGIHGPGESLIYFVDRYKDFSIYDVDFVAMPTREVPPVSDLHFFGVVQSVLDDRTAPWKDFYHYLFGFVDLPMHTSFGILPKGALLESPCKKFFWQLIEPPAGSEDFHWTEDLLRIGLGTADVERTTQTLRERGIDFVQLDPIRPSEKGALTKLYLGGVSFELVHSDLRTAVGAKR
jgi:4-hydroxyphenylpyruvate dioxygenase